MADRYERRRSFAFAFALPLWVGVAAPAAAHVGHSSPQPWDACASAELGDACEWENDAGDLYVGTCREVSERLLCVRKEPIIPAAARDHDHDFATVHQHAEGAQFPLGWVIVGLALSGLLVLRRSMRQRCF